MHSGISLKWKFWLNYMTIGLIACTTVGLSIYLFSVDQLNRNVNESAAIEMSTAVTYLEEQVDVFRDIASRVVTTSYYRASYRNEGVANQRTILRDLNQYSNYSPLIDSFFLYTRADGKVWKPGAQNTFDYYANLELHVPDVGALHTHLETLESITGYRIDQRFYLICLPLHIDANRKEASDSVFNVVLYRSTLDKYLAIYAPNFKGCLNLYMNGHPLFSANTEWNQDEYKPDAYGLLRCGSRIAYDSADGIFRIIADTDEIPFFQTQQYVRQINVAIISLCVLLVISIAYLLAARSYSPIYQLVKRHQPRQRIPSHIANRDELAQIDALLTQSSASESLIREQTNELKRKQTLLSRQFFLHLLNGSLVGLPETRAKKLGINLTGSLFRMITITFASHDVIEDEALAIERLSDDTMRFFCLQLNVGTECAVIMNADDEGCFDVMDDLLLALNEADGNLFTVLYRGEICDGLGSLSFMLPSTEIQNTVANICDAVSCGRKADAMNAYREFLTKAETFPAVQRQYASSELIVRLINGSGVLVDEALRSKAALLLTETDSTQRLDEMESLLEELCIRKPALNPDEHADNSVLAYIDQHLNDSGLDISCVGQALSLPQNEVRRVIRDRMGVSPREHFNRRRVEMAKSLLSGGQLSISEISQSVGYSSVSYFIKNFRMLTGRTPAAYRTEKQETKEKPRA